MRQGVGVDLLRQHQSVAARLCQPNHFLQPGRSGGLHVHAGSGAGQCAANDRIQRELVAAAVDAELEIRRKAVPRHRVGDHREVIVELAFELGQVAHVIDTLVEAAGELWRDGLHPHLLICQRGQDDEQFQRRLRRVGLVHRHLGDQVSLALRRDDVAIDLPGVLDGQQILAHHDLHVGP